MLADVGPTTIMHRRGQTRFLEPGEEDEAPGVSSRQRGGQVLPPGLRTGQGHRHPLLAELALAGLAEGTQTDAGAVLLLPRISTASRSAEASWKSWPREARPSGRTIRSPIVLAATVMREGEAVLARNVVGDSTLGSRDSQGVIHTTSVICARSAVADKCWG